MVNIYNCFKDFHHGKIYTYILGVGKNAVHYIMVIGKNAVGYILGIGMNCVKP